MKSFKKQINKWKQSQRENCTHWSMNEKRKVRCKVKGSRAAMISWLID